ncbi:hypothetical protein CBR_g26241 [Chara braunii]|uniref:Uncharacterized protein n=1 Tax=Chara braunii TaxID=69332 RepID=A0A388L7F4_CHABU|nr:hypothetical protein CBR_g26241 [Chara braunii]|eukprot:GBG78208.1 hypothetical protein CBR_g26241 [Chara braunii]
MTPGRRETARGVRTAAQMAYELHTGKPSCTGEPSGAGKQGTARGKGKSRGVAKLPRGKERTVAQERTSCAQVGERIETRADKGNPTV